MAPGRDVGVGDQRRAEISPKPEDPHHPKSLRQQANRRRHDRREPVADTHVKPGQRGRRQRSGQHADRDRTLGEQRCAHMAAEEDAERGARSDAPLNRSRGDAEQHCHGDEIEDVVDPQPARHEHQNRSAREMHDVGARRVQHIGTGLRVKCAERERTGREQAQVSEGER